MSIKQRLILPIARILGYGGFAFMTLVILLGIWSLIRLTVALVNGENTGSVFSLNYIYPQLIINTVFAVETLMYIGLIGVVLVAWLSEQKSERRIFRIFLLPYITFLLTYGMHLIR